MVREEDVIEAVDKLHKKHGKSGRCTVIELKIDSPKRIEEIRKIVVQRFGNTSRVYFYDQTVKSFFDKMEWKEVI